jgi:hypothetical protein
MAQKRHVPVGTQKTSPASDYHGEILDADLPLEDPAWAGFQYDKVSPEAFDIDKYNQLAYQQALQNADNSVYGKIAGIGDNVLSAKGMGIHSGSWLSRINQFNADTREAHEKAAFKALSQTIIAQQQKFNQALSAGKMNLDTFAHATDANLRRLGIHVDSGKLASALDQVKRGDYEHFNNILKVWADAMVAIKENNADRETGVTTARISATAGTDAAKIHANAGINEAKIRSAAAINQAKINANASENEARIHAAAARYGARLAAQNRGRGQISPHDLRKTVRNNVLWESVGNVGGQYLPDVGNAVWNGVRWVYRKANSVLHPNRGR